MTKVSVIIINYNTTQMTEKVIRTLVAAEKNLDLEIILIDNNSLEPLNKENLFKLGIEPIYNKENLGFAKAVNQGIKIATGDFVLLLNSDVLVSEGSISKMIQSAQGEFAIVGPKMLFPSGNFQASFGVFPGLWSELLRFSLLYKIFPGGTFAINSFFKKINLNNAYPVDWVSGGCMLLRRDVLQKLGGFDEKYFLGVEDIDFCFQAAKAGFKTLYCPEAEVIHYHGHSSGGTRSLKRIAFDRDGLDYFFKKNHPANLIARYSIRLMHDMKLSLLRLF